MSVLDVISTPLREVRRLLALHALLDRLFQSTPLREGRPDVGNVGHFAQFISIHAPL